MCHCKFHQSYRRFTTRHHKLIPIFGFGRRSKSSTTAHRHWLSGKGGFGGGNNADSTTDGAVATGNNSGGNCGGGMMSGSNKSASAGLHHYGGGGGLRNTSAPLPPCQNNVTLNQQGRLQQEHRNNFNRHLAMNLENDMYYTVDFSDSQHSPLIQ